MVKQTLLVDIVKSGTFLSRPSNPKIKGSSGKHPEILSMMLCGYFCCSSNIADCATGPFSFTAIGGISPSPDVCAH